MTDYSPGIRQLAGNLGLDPRHVAHAVQLAARTFHRIRIAPGMTVDQYQRLFTHDRHSVVIVANIALRHAGHRDDAQRLLDIYKASVNSPIRRRSAPVGLGTLPQHHDHLHTQEAVRILTAAGLPPIHTDGEQVLQPGFLVLPGEAHDVPGWVFIAPDADAETRPGFTGGDHGYLSVMAWGGWGVITERQHGGFYPACHPSHRDNPFLVSPTSPARREQP